MHAQRTPVVRLERINFPVEKTFEILKSTDVDGERRDGDLAPFGNSKKRVSFKSHSSICYFTEQSGSSVLHSAELNDTPCAETFDIPPSSDARIIDPAKEKQVLCLKDVVIPLEKLPASLLSQVRSENSDHRSDDNQNSTECPNPQADKYEERAESILIDDSQKLELAEPNIAISLLHTNSTPRISLQRLPNNVLDIHLNRNNSASSKEGLICSDQDVRLQEFTEETAVELVDAKESNFSSPDEVKSVKSDITGKEPFVLLERLNLVVPESEDAKLTEENNSKKFNCRITPTENVPHNLKLPKTCNKKKRCVFELPETSVGIKKCNILSHKGEKKNSKIPTQNGTRTTVSDDIKFSSSKNPKIMSIVPCIDMQCDSPCHENLELNYLALSKQAGNVFSNSVYCTSLQNNGCNSHKNSSQFDVGDNQIQKRNSQIYSDSSEDDLPLSLLSKGNSNEKTAKKRSKKTSCVVPKFTDFNVLCMSDIIPTNSLTFLSDFQKDCSPSAVINTKAQKKMVSRCFKNPESLSKLNKKCKKPMPKKCNGNFFVKMNAIGKLTVSRQKRVAKDLSLSASLSRIRLEHSYGLPCNKENESIAKAAKDTGTSILPQKRKKKKCSRCKDRKKTSIKTLHALLNSYLQSFFVQFDELGKNKNNKEKHDEAVMRRKENVYKLILSEVHAHLKNTCRRAKKSYKVQNEELLTGSLHNKEINKEGKYKLGFLTQNKSQRLYHKCVAAERMFLSKYKMGKKQERKLKKFFHTLKINSLS